MEAPMTPDDVRRARRALGMTQNQLAIALRMGKDGKRSVRRWEAGDRPVSGPASVAIEALVEGWRPTFVDRAVIIATTDYQYDGVEP